MTTLQQAAQQALEALTAMTANGRVPPTAKAFHSAKHAATALRQALAAELQAEPVGFAVPGAIEWARRQSEVTIKLTRNPQPEYGFTDPLYTRPQPAQQPLTDEQIDKALERVNPCALTPKGIKRAEARAIEHANGIK